MVRVVRVSFDRRLLVACDVDRWRPQAVLAVVQEGRVDDNGSADQKLVTCVSESVMGIAGEAIRTRAET